MSEWLAFSISETHNNKSLLQSLLFLFLVKRTAPTKDECVTIGIAKLKKINTQSDGIILIIRWFFCHLFCSLLSRSLFLYLYLLPQSMDLHSKSLWLLEFYRRWRCNYLIFPYWNGWQVLLYFSLLDLSLELATTILPIEKKWIITKCTCTQLGLPGGSKLEEIHFIIRTTDEKIIFLHCRPYWKTLRYNKPVMEQQNQNYYT